LLSGADAAKECKYDHRVPLGIGIEAFLAWHGERTNL
jgi:hypothetical protein